MNRFDGKLAVVAGGSSGIELVGPYTLTQQVARRMVSEGRRRAIVNISSEQEQTPSRGLSGHCSAKAGLAILTQGGGH